MSTQTTTEQAAPEVLYMLERGAWLPEYGESPDTYLELRLTKTRKKTYVFADGDGGMRLTDEELRRLREGVPGLSGHQPGRVFIRRKSWGAGQGCWLLTAEEMAADVAKAEARRREDLIRRLTNVCTNGLDQWTSAIPAAHRMSVEERIRTGYSRDGSCGCALCHSRVVGRASLRSLCGLAPDASDEEIIVACRSMLATLEPQPQPAHPKLEVRELLRPLVDEGTLARIDGTEWLSNAVEVLALCADVEGQDDYMDRMLEALHCRRDELSPNEQEYLDEVTAIRDRTDELYRRDDETPKEAPTVWEHLHADDAI